MDGDSKVIRRIVSQNRKPKAVALPETPKSAHSGESCSLTAAETGDHNSKAPNAGTLGVA